jgi:hypothetical protein
MAAPRAGGMAEQAACAVGRVCFRAGPVTNEIYFIFIYSVTVLVKFWKIYI